ncbi:MAG TPA: alanine racemase [Candidatus Magasanikbacteria bacterium]|nr:alanine racemase [Candidatus Magasanikbacteria bacterium]
MTKPLSYIEISKSALISNLVNFRRFLPSQSRLAAVIKGNAYGHGQNEVAKAIEKHVDYFQLDGIEELRQLRQVTKKPVLILGYVQPADLEEAVRLNAELGIYDISIAKKLNTLGKKLRKKPKVHIKIDAYLGRQGILPTGILKFAKILRTLKHIEVVSAYSHFANIEDTVDDTHARKQIETFENAVEILRANGFEKIQTHMSATSGALVFEGRELRSQIVRIGIGLYGLWPSEALEKKYSKKLKLTPVMRLVTHVAQVKELPPGHTVGYGLTFTTWRKTRIAVIPLGYSDGLDRRMTNNGNVLIQGKRCPIIGRVAMNMFVVDVTRVPNVRANDEFIIIGKQKNETISAEEIAKNIDTINYEITTRLSPLLPKILKK